MSHKHNNVSLRTHQWITPRTEIDRKGQIPYNPAQLL